jgi:diguanylate cyclase (GGDEF)-like protein
MITERGMHRDRQIVLIIDDSPLNIQLLSGILGDEQDIIFATRCDDAITLATRELPDLIMLEVVMPEMNGYDVCRKLKENPDTRKIPVIFVTAKSELEDEAMGLSCGAIDYITKPYHAAIVKARVKNHLELKRYRDYLENLSAIDGLTGIPNRREFEIEYDIEWRRCMRSGSSLSLLFLDIDFFKQYNDIYGHIAGDDCLRTIAHLFTDTVNRPGDCVARIGGEEFVCILPETDPIGARLVADLLLERVQELALPHRGSETAPYITISIGVSTTIPTKEDNPESLIGYADQMLYRAKENGRNRVESD